MFFIRARMGPFHPRADGTRSHPRADGAPGAIRAALRTWPHDRRNSSILWHIAYTTASNTAGEKDNIHKILSRQCTLVLATREMHINAIARLQSRFFSSDDEVTDCPHSSLPSSELRDEESAMPAAKT